MKPETKSGILLMTSVAMAVGCNQQAGTEKSSPASLTGGLDRTVLPIKEPTFPPISEQIASNFGGTRNGMVISWPEGIKSKNEVRSQFHHVIDITLMKISARRTTWPRKILPSLKK
jgi:hypothetical protein